MAAGCLLLAAGPAAAATALEALATFEKSAGQAYQGRLVSISGENGGPQPGRWHIFARDVNDPRRLVHFVVERGQVGGPAALNDARSRQIDTQVMVRNDLRIDSDRVFEVVNQMAVQARVGFDTIDYRLALHPRSRRATYDVQIKNRPGQVVGLISIDATSGQVVASRFPERPIDPARAGQGGDRMVWRGVREEMGRARIGFDQAVQGVRDRLQTR